MGEGRELNCGDLLTFFGRFFEGEKMGGTDKENPCPAEAQSLRGHDPTNHAPACHHHHHPSDTRAFLNCRREVDYSL